MTHPKKHYQNKVVCVTGAGGSIGSEICRKLVEYEASQIIMVGHSELPLYEIGRELEAKAPAGTIVKALGSVGDEPFMRDLFNRFAPDIVIHAAAHKHVPLCEQNPLEAIENNVGGTMTLARAAASLGVGQFVLVSSDKAVRPSSVMGATKRACELYLEFFAARTSMRCTTVRFGNVLNSSGSVLPLWREQLRKGEKITLTDKRCTRYFMTIPEAVELTLGAASLPRTGLFVLDMGQPQSIYELAKQTVAATLYPGADCYTPDDHIVETGLRPGEKLEEELSYGGESVKTALPRVLRVRENPTGRLTRWSDFSDLLMAAQCRAKDMALDQLWSMVR
jgi:FlaA1/EpsC-like NDP-sugar epimerase